MKHMATTRIGNATWYRMDWQPHFKPGAIIHPIDRLIAYRTSNIKVETLSQMTQGSVSVPFSPDSRTFWQQLKFLFHFRKKFFHRFVMKIAKSS